MEIVNLKKLWNFVVDKLLIWICLGPQIIFMSSNPAGHVAMKNVATSDFDWGGREPADGALSWLAFLLLFSGLSISAFCDFDFQFFLLLYAINKKYSAKTVLPTNFLSSVLCRVWHSARPLPRHSAKHVIPVVMPTFQVSERIIGAETCPLQWFRENTCLLWTEKRDHVKSFFFNSCYMFVG